MPQMAQCVSNRLIKGNGSGSGLQAIKLVVSRAMEVECRAFVLSVVFLYDKFNCGGYYETFGADRFPGSGSKSARAV